MKLVSYNMRSPKFGRFSLVGLLGCALSVLLVSACERGSYAVDIFPEQHYQQSVKSGEPPRLAPHPKAVPISGREIMFDAAAAAGVRNPVQRTTASLDRGNEVFRVNCAMCHGDQGRGSGAVGDVLVANNYVRPPNLNSEATQAKTDGELFWILTNGIVVMPEFKNLLSEEDRWSVVHYVRFLADQES